MLASSMTFVPWQPQRFSGSLKSAPHRRNPEPLNTFKLNYIFGLFQARLVEGLFHVLPQRFR
jgi:hypothetical protein